MDRLISTARRTVDHHGEMDEDRIRIGLNWYATMEMTMRMIWIAID